MHGCRTGGQDRTAWRGSKHYFKQAQASLMTLPLCLRARHSRRFTWVLELMHEDPRVGAAGGGCKQEAAWRPPTDQAIVCVLKATNQMDM